MMSEHTNPLESTWEKLLSRDIHLVQATYANLDYHTREQVLRHLQRIASEPGWHAEQVISARYAIEAISSQDKDDLKTSASD